MVTWVLRCKLYPGATPWRSIWSARPLRGGGLIPQAIAGLDIWLSRQNPAYRPVSHQKSTAHRSGAFLSRIYNPGVPNPEVICVIKLVKMCCADSKRILNLLCVTFLWPNKKVTKEIVIGEALMRSLSILPQLSTPPTSTPSRPPLCTPPGLVEGLIVIGII